jgi:hypothetical protein
MIPSGSLTSGFDPSFMVAFALQQIQRDMAQDTKRLCPLVFTDPACILMQGDIEHPKCNPFSTPQCCRTASPKRTPSAGIETKEYRLSISTFSPMSRCNSTMPRLCTLLHEPFAPHQSIAEVIP